MDKGVEGKAICMDVHPGDDNVSNVRNALIQINLPAELTKIVYTVDTNIIILHLKASPEPTRSSGLVQYITMLLLTWAQQGIGHWVKLI